MTGLTASPPGTAAGPGTLRQLATLAGASRGRLLLVALFVTGSALLELVPPLAIGAVIDDHLIPGNARGLLALGALYLGATAAVQATTFGYTYLAASVAQRVLNTLRMRLFAHLQRLPLAYHDQTALGDSISRCTADIETVDTLFSSGVATLLANLVRLVTAAAAMLVLSPPLSLVAALAVPPLVLITRQFQLRVRAAERTNRLATGLLNTHLQEGLAGVEVVRTFGREAYFGERIRAALGRLVAATDRSNVYSALYTPTTAILSALVIALLLWAGTRSTFAGWGVTLGMLTAFILLFQRFSTPITELGDQWQTVQAALSGAERVFEVLALPAERLAPAAPATGVGIELRDVHFGYGATAVLHGVTLAVRPGEHVALVGRTGAGKTSALHLLAGLYAPWSGAVRVAGVDPRSLDEDDRSHVVAVVPQVVHLFQGTLLENLTLAGPDIPREAVEAAAHISGADAFVRLLPQGYDTPLDTGGRAGGVQLSAGQQQLLALTRALVLDAPVLLLDEATAAVDAVTDAAFREALREHVLRPGCAVLTVAHRLATAREADRVVLLDGGRVVEEGAPAALVARGGAFAVLLELEAAGWDWRSAPAPPRDEESPHATA